MRQQPATYSNTQESIYSIYAIRENILKSFRLRHRRRRRHCALCVFDAFTVLSVCVCVLRDEYGC